MANTSIKRIQIDKATSNMVLIVSIAAFLVIFSIISGHTLITILSYQNRVIDKKELALKQLNLDITASKQLVGSYQNFDNTTTNLLGSPTTGTNNTLNDNAKIVLDALPGIYDYPALTNSLQSVLSNQGVNIDSIGGTDNQASIGSDGTGATPSSSSPTTSTTTSVAPVATSPVIHSASGTGAVAMPFSFSIDGPYQNVQNVITNFEKSIRPFQFLTLDFSGNQSDVTLSVTAQTFYQPQTSFNITTETVK